MMLFYAVLCVQLLGRYSEPHFLQRRIFEGHNICSVVTDNKPVKTWSYIDNLTSSVMAKEVMECGFHCIHNGSCRTFQVVRTLEGSGLCYITMKLPLMYFVEDDICISYLKRDRNWNCVIQWNPKLFDTKYYKDDYRVMNMDNSWFIRNDNRGIHVFKINSIDCNPASLEIFDTFASSSEELRFRSYFSSAMTTVLIGYSVGDFWTPNIGNFLNNLRINYIDTSNSSLIFICSMGTPRYCRYQSSANDFGFGYVTIITGDKDLTFLTIANRADTGEFFTNLGV